MDLLKRFCSCCQFYKSVYPFSKKAPKEKSRFTKYEYYTYKFQSIVIWEHPAQTVSCLLIIQLLFWMIVKLYCKFYGIVFTLLLILCTHDVWVEKIWPEIRLPHAEVATYPENLSSNPRILTTSQIDEYFNNIVLHMKMTLIRLKNLRNSNPALFCWTLSMFFGILGIVGCTLSGVWLLYIIVMGIFLLPGIYLHVLPNGAKMKLKRYLKDFTLIISELMNNKDEYEEYVPKLSEKVLNEAYATAFEVKSTGDSFPSLTDEDMITGIEPIAIMEDSNDSFAKFSDMKGNLDFSDTSSVSSDVSESLKFQGMHFNNATDEFDSSEEDSDNALVSNATHSHRSDDTLLNSFASRIPLPNINQLGRNILSMVTSTTSSSSTAPALARSNTDEEFEIINESDIN